MNDENAIHKEQNICRTFEFINYNIPPVAEDDTFNYTTIGFFDALRTERLTNGSQNDPTLNRMCQTNETYALNLDGKYSFQNTLAIRKGTPKEDDEFWKPDSNLPLCFVIFLQLRGCDDKTLKQNPCSLKEMNHGIEKSIEDLQVFVSMHPDKKTSKIRNAEIQYLCYQTLDKNDFVVGIKSRRYDIVSDFLLFLHKNMKQTYPILYSYSIFSIHNELLKEITYTDKITSDEYYKNNPSETTWLDLLSLQEESIPSLSFQGITNTDDDIDLEVRYRKYIYKLHYALYHEEFSDSSQQDFRLYETIGDFDFRYIAREVKLENLLHAMTKDGPLNYHSDILKESLYSSMLVINSQDYHDLKDLTKPCPKQNKNTLMDAERCNELRNHLKIWGEVNHVIEVPSLQLMRNTTYQSAVNETLFISLWKILESLAALERAPSQKYDFETLYWTYRRLIELLTGRKIHPILSDEDLKFFFQNNESYYWGDFERLPRLIQCLSTALHSTLRTDIQFFQVSDFNVFVNYAPAKLRSFYSVWITHLTDYYSQFRREKNNYYEFVISMNNYPGIRTRELKHTDQRNLSVGNQDYRLMYIEIPERLLYRPEYTCFMLAHEVAHFGGGFAKRRTREDCRSETNINRFDLFIDCISSWYTLMFHSDIMSSLYTKAQKDDSVSYLLLLLLQKYLDGENHKKIKNISETVTYKGINMFLKHYLYNSDETPLIEGNLNAKLGEHAVQLINVFLDMFIDNRTGHYFLNAYIVAQEMETDFRKYLLENWDTEKWRYDVLDSFSSMIGKPLQWTNNLLNEILFQFHTSINEALSNTSALIMAPYRPSIPVNLMDFIREAHVDLISILSMRISPEQYFDVLLKTNQIEGKNNNSKELLLPYPAAARIFTVVQSMKHLYRKELNNLESKEKKLINCLAKWDKLDWQNHDARQDISFTEKETAEQYNIIYNAFRYLWKKVDDRSYFIIPEQSKTDSQIPQYIIYFCWNVLFSITQYLDACGTEILKSSQSEQIADFIEPLLSDDIYRQMEKINLELWKYENECVKKYNSEKDGNEFHKHQ